MQKPTGEPRSTMGIVGVLIAQACSPAEQGAIFGAHPLAPPAPLDPALLPIAAILGPLSRTQQAMLGRMLAVLGIDRLSARWQRG